MYSGLLLPGYCTFRAGNAFVLQDPNDDPAVHGLTFNRLIGAYLPALAHCARSQHVGQGDMTLLSHNVRYVKDRKSVV